MHACTHCGTPYSPVREDDRFCCKGCEYVHELIHDEGLDRFYELKQDTPGRPVRSLPFETRDLAWLEKRISECEGAAGGAGRASARFSLEGMSCVACVWLVEKLYLRYPGAIEAAARPGAGTVRLEWVPGMMDFSGLARELASFGYALGPSRHGETGETGSLGTRLGLCFAFALNAMAFTLPRYLGMPESFAFGPIFQLVTFLSATLAMMVGGSYFIRRAWRAARSGVLHIDLPIALGLILAFAGSLAGWAWKIEGLLYFDFVAIFVCLMLAGRYLQISAMERNRHRLSRQRPVPENVRCPDRAVPVPLAELAPGTRFEIRPGESVPVSAVLESAAGDFSLEWINGEAEPATFRAGRAVPAGAIFLGDRPVLLGAAESWQDSLLAKLIGEGRPEIRVPGLERLLRAYLIVVLIAGAAGFTGWYQHGSAAMALQVMISVFVVSCPCALGVALPMADELAGSIMERAGVFIREPLLWARLRKVRTILFDKTGTLTLERPVLANRGVLGTLDEEEILALARLASGSAHPVARGLLEALGRKGQRLLRSRREMVVTDIPGTGRSFQEGGIKWFLGRPAVDSGHDTAFSRDGRVIALFRFQESLRPDAIGALAALRERNFRLVILSGDRPGKVTASAELLGIAAEDAHASLHPEEKQRLVREIDHRDTLYLGDGANDSLAFNAAWTTGMPVADRGILGAKADFYFLGQGLRFLPRLLELAIRRRRVVSAAFAFALLYNFCVVGIALAGRMNPLLAAILMPLSSAFSLSIVALGLRGTFPERIVEGAGNGCYPVPVQSSEGGGRNDTGSETLRANAV